MGTLTELPTELLEGILRHLSVEDLAQLWKCSPTLSSRVSYALFYPPKRRDETMIWACKAGEINIIKTAVAYGASPSSITCVEFQSSSRATLNPTDPPVASPLVLTARKGHREAFNTLLELGARLGDCTVVQRKRLGKLLLKKKAWGIAYNMIKADLGTELWEEGFALPLVTLIRRDAPLDLLKLLLKKGADPNVVVPGGNGDLTSPLATAILRGLLQTGEFLIANGASIHGSIKCFGVHKSSTKPFIYVRPDHLPIYAAAVFAGRTGDTTWLDLCLRHGSDINMLAPAIPGDKTYSAGHIAMTPFLRYLEAIEDWTPLRRPHPIDGIRFFIEKGAQIDLSDKQPQRKWEWVPDVKYSRSYEGMSAPQILLYKWNLRYLKKPRFFDTMQFLIQNGGGLHCAKDLLQEFSQDSQVTSFPMLRSNPNHPDNVPQWWDIVELLIDKLQEKSHNNLHWIYATGHVRDASICHHPVDQKLKDDLLRVAIKERADWMEFYGTLNRLVIDRILAQGANINARSGESNETVLIEICNKIIKGFANEEGYYMKKWRNNMMRDKAAEFCLSLVDKGADPYIVTTQGKTAMDLLREHENVPAGLDAEFLENLAETLKLERKHFLELGPTPNILVQRADIRRYRIPGDPWTFGYRFERAAADRKWNR